MTWDLKKFKRDQIRRWSFSPNLTQQKEVFFLFGQNDVPISNFILIVYALKENEIKALTSFTFQLKLKKVITKKYIRFVPIHDFSWKRKNSMNFVMILNVIKLMIHVMMLKFSENYNVALKSHLVGLSCYSILRKIMNNINT